MLKVKIVMTVEGVIEIDEKGYVGGTSNADMIQDAIANARRSTEKEGIAKILAIHGTVIE